MATDYILHRLFEIQDLDYRNFHSKLIPNIDPEFIIGVRTPALRKLAQELWKEGNLQDFMSELPHKYYEENNLHAFFIERIKDYDECVEALNSFLPYVDNWATCDMMSPRTFKKVSKDNVDVFIRQIRIWTDSEHTYMVRFGIGMLMKYFLDENFSEEYLRLVADVESDEYYINMMRAWYFATALSKQYDIAVKYIERKELDKWTHNKAIQKAVESNRITYENKKYLKKYKY